MTIPKNVTVSYSNTKTIPIEQTQKLFFGKYPFAAKLEPHIKAHDYQVKYGERDAKMTAHPGPIRVPKHYRGFYTALDPKVGALFPADKTKYRANLADYSDVRVYFEHREDYEAFYKAAGEYIASLSETTDELIDIMKDDKKLIYRDNLFFDRYEFRVYLDPKDWFTQNPNGIEEIKEIFKNEAKSLAVTKTKTSYYNFKRYKIVTNQNSTDLYRAEPTSDYRVYFKDEETLVRWRLSANCGYKKIEQVVLNNNKNKEGNQDASQPVSQAPRTEST